MVGGIEEREVVDDKKDRQGSVKYPADLTSPSFVSEKTRSHTISKISQRITQQGATESFNSVNNFLSHRRKRHPVAFEADYKGRRMSAQNLSVAGEIWPMGKR